MPQGNHLFLPRSPTARARSSGPLLPHVTRPNSAAESPSPRSPSVTLPCASSSRSHKYRSPHRYVILCPLCCHRDLAIEVNLLLPLTSRKTWSRHSRRTSSPCRFCRQNNLGEPAVSSSVYPCMFFPQPYEVPRVSLVSSASPAMAVTCTRTQIR
jgi:hypothetical protein